MKKKLIIDTDAVSDDVRAISLALQHPDVEVLALTCVNGCITVQQAVANLARTLRANTETIGCPHCFERNAVPIVLCPWETFLFTSEKSEVDFHAHLKIDAPLAKFFKTATSLGVEELKKNNRQFSYCDEVAVGVAIEPEKIF
uniref:Inosine/uridine-preferring nucleoside hydrolase domain-containing protein n=1 Tax=Ditylenchus dipsaci TaxID=166011 RepID=A0A915CRD8_9BILA